jgi:sugar lactone lactonase YvrE
MNVYRCRHSGAGWGKLEMLNDDKPLVDDSGYDPSDLEVDRQGRLILRLDDPEAKSSGHNLVLFRYAADGKRERLADLGPCGTTATYGLHQTAGGTLYVASAASRSVWCFSAQGEVLWKTAHNVHQPPDSLPLRSPLGITTDSAGRVWITDPARNHVVCLDAQGKFLKSYGHFGTIDDRDGWALCNPVGIAAIQDAHGTDWLYIADVNNQRIVKWKIAVD